MNSKETTKYNKIRSIQWKVVYVLAASRKGFQRLILLRGTIGGLIKIRSKIRSPRTDWFRDLAIRKAKEGRIGAQLSTVVLFNCKTFSIQLKCLAQSLKRKTSSHGKKTSTSLLGPSIHSRQQVLLLQPHRLHLRFQFRTGHSVLSSEEPIT